MDFNEALRKTDVKNTERKMEKDVVDELGGNEVSFINSFLKKGEKIDGKTIKSLDMLLRQYKAKIGTSKVKSDPNIALLATLVAAMKVELER